MQDLCINGGIFKCFSVPNASFEIYSPSFMERFIESHAVMTQVLNIASQVTGIQVISKWSK